VIASSGTALTDDQVKLVKRFTKNIHLSFDSDDAGVQASIRAIKVCQQFGMNISIISTGGSKDAADMIVENEQDWKDLVSKPINYIDYFCSHNYLGKPFEDLNIEDRRKYYDFLLDLASSVSHSIEKDYFAKKIAEIFNVSVTQVYADVKDLIKSRKSFKKATVETKKEETYSYTLADIILGLGWIMRDEIDVILDFINEKDMSEQIGLAYQTLTSHTSEDLKSFENLDFLNKDSSAAFELLLMYLESLDYLANVKMQKNELNLLIKQYKKYIVRQNQQTLLNEYKKARESGDLKRSDELFEKYNQQLHSK